jgi:hypothetical protein
MDNVSWEFSVEAETGGSAKIHLKGYNIRQLYDPHHTHQLG